MLPNLSFFCFNLGWLVHVLVQTQTVFFRLGSMNQIFDLNLLIYPANVSHSTSKYRSIGISSSMRNSASITATYSVVDWHYIPYICNNTAILRSKLKKERDECKTFFANHALSTAVKISPLAAESIIMRYGLWRDKESCIQGYLRNHRKY